MCVFQVIVSECVSSLHGVEGSEGVSQRADEDSLSGESLDSLTQGMYGVQIQILFLSNTSLYIGLSQVSLACTLYTVIVEHI